MSTLYVLLNVLLGALRLLVGRRVARLERKFARVAREAQGLVKVPLVRQGNSNQSDPYVQARQQYLLGQAVHRRDRVEARYTAWQVRADRLERLQSGLRGWQGRWVPYFCGALDMFVALALVGYFTAGEESQQLVADLLARWQG